MVLQASFPKLRESLIASTLPPNACPTARSDNQQLRHVTVDVALLILGRLALV
jgi:hypothetical protein